MASAETGSTAAHSLAGRAPAGVYVHLPFCSAICPYRDFAVTVGGADRRRALVAAIIAELEGVASRLDLPVDTIYFGGGTPSLHTAGEIAEIVAAIRTVLEVDPQALVFLEANPEDVTLESLDAWVALGVGTLSLGLQALDDQALAFLGRGHSTAQACQAVRLAKGAGVDSVSVDLIYARPGQTKAAWRRELDEVAALEPDHLSCYQLTVHRHTPFGRRRAAGRLEELPEPDQAELFLATHRRLAELGYAAYEVSSFARHRSHRSRHNMKYWNGSAYLGVGPSAHSFDGITRWWNVASTKEYVARVEANESPLAAEERPSPGQRLIEELMLGLRQPAGLDLGDLGRRYGVELTEENEERLAQWEDRGWIRREGGRVRPLLEGLLVADRLASDLSLGQLE